MNIPQKSVFRVPVFQVGGEDYTWIDIFYSASLRGDWDKLIHTTRVALLCQKQFEATEEEVEQASEQFRYDRDLITAEEMEAWLNKWELSLEEWMDSLERKILLQYQNDLDRDDSPDEIDSNEVLSALEADGICSGEFEKFALALAGQAAVQAGMEDMLPVTEEDVEGYRNSLSADMKDYEGIDRLIRLQLGFEKSRSQWIHPNRVQEYIQAHRMDYVRFRLRSMTFDEEELALEAAMCAREDGDSATMVSSLAKAKLEQRDCFLNDLEDEIRNIITGAQRGEFVGPIKTKEGKFTLIQVADKQNPSVDQPEVRSRVEENLIQGIVRYHINNQVQWHVQF